MDLRCPSKLHGKLEAQTIEFKCKSRWCGARPGVVIIHEFDCRTGDLINTKTYKNPRKEQR